MRCLSTLDSVNSSQDCICLPAVGLRILRARKPQNTGGWVGLVHVRIPDCKMLSETYRQAEVVLCNPAVSDSDSPPSTIHPCIPVISAGLPGRISHACYADPTFMLRSCPTARGLGARGSCATSGPAKDPGRGAQPDWLAAADVPAATACGLRRCSAVVHRQELFPVNGWVGGRDAHPR